MNCSPFKKDQTYFFKFDAFIKQNYNILNIIVIVKFSTFEMFKKRFIN